VDNVLKRPGIAVVGHGYWGRHHVRNFHDLNALVAVCDERVDRLRAAAQEYTEVAVVRDFSDILVRDDIQGVVLATPAETHFTLARECLNAGLDVLVEKPLALRVEEGAELVALAKQTERILMVGHILEYHPAVVALRKQIADGALGRLRYVYSNRVNLGKVRREENILWSFAPHDVAILLRLLGEMPTSVSARGGMYLLPHIADVTVSTFAFPSGVRAHIHVSWLHPFKEQKLVVVGDKAMAVFDDQEKSLNLFKHSMDWVDRVPVPRRADAEQIHFNEAEPLRLECEAFLTAIEMRTPPLTDGESGQRVLQVLSRCQESLEQDGAVLPMAKDNTVAVHPTAIVDSGARVGTGTRIWHYSHVMSGATIGSNCVLGQNVFVSGDVAIGNGVKIQNNVSLYSGVTLADDVFCGPSMVFTNVRNPRAHVDRKHAFEPTPVGRGATLGANCTIVCGNTIGAYATVAAGAVVTTDVPDHALMMGVPARVSGWMCACGERLGGGADRPVDDLSCGTCSASYRAQAQGAGLEATPK
jgi:UDP-2-acetamido-3-amino-2,3-dideoxy-glucuronate N-acetyltransferase